MFSKRVKCLSVAVFSLISLLISITGFTQDHNPEHGDNDHKKEGEVHQEGKKKGFNASEAFYTL